MSKGRILLAEDDGSLREALSMFLASKGYDVDPAENGLAARTKLGDARYDVLLTDLMMPEVDGYELVSGIQNSPPDSPPAVVVMTGQGTVESAMKIMKSGVSAFLRKPLNMDELEVAVSTAVDRSRLDRELARYYRELDMKVEARTRELSLLNRFSSVVNSSFSLERILKDAVDYLTESLNSDASWIYLLDKGDDSLELRAHKGFTDEFVNAVSSLDVSSGYTGRTFRRGGAFILNDLSSASSVPIAGLVASEGFQSAMHAAIKSGDKILGTMGVASRSGFTYKDEDLQLLTSFGNQIGVAMEKTTLYEKERASARDLRNKVNELVTLNEMGSMLRMTMSMDVAVRTVVTTVSQGLGLDRVCLWLMSEDGERFRLAAAKGSDEKFVGTTVDAGPAYAAGKAFEHASDAVVEGSFCSRLGADMSGDADGSPRFPNVVVPLFTRASEEYSTKCWEHFGCSEEDCPAYDNPMACWMVDESCVRRFNQSGTLLDKMEVCRDCEVYRSGAKGTFIGALCVERLDSGISADDIKTLGVFANTAAAALENIRLIENMVKTDRFIESIMTNMASGLLVTDKDGRIRMLNNVGAQILGIERDRAEGVSITDLIPEAARFIVVEDSPVGHEVDIKTGAGVLPVGYSNSYLRDPKGNPDGVIVVFRDLSDIKMLQERIREGDRFAAIGKVAAGVAHEIRNPLFGITSVAQILGREVSGDSPLKALIDAMLSETSRLNTLVEELLLYGRATKISPVPTDLRALIEDVLAFHQPAITGKDITVTTGFDPAMSGMVVDPHQMRQIFLNLLFNALDATHPGGRIDITAVKNNSGMGITISDNGVGIPADELPKVFDLFFTTKDKGTGLGLAICRKIVEDHGGTVSIRSRQGEGTDVVVMLPVKE